MNDKLKSAESAIHFIQKEHERVLHGLHMEIERLQQKCSGLLTSTKMYPPVFTKILLTFSVIELRECENKGIVFYNSYYDILTSIFITQ